MMVPRFIFFCFTLLFFLFLNPSISLDSITPNQTLTDNGETLISKGQTFELGFFTPFNSENRYIGIWFKNIPQITPIWVANKNKPLKNSADVLHITTSGNIVITNNQSGEAIWSSNSSFRGINPVLQLLDTGNLVVRNGSYNYIWQSFDFPYDTLVPGMKLGWDLRNNQEWYLTSWKSLQDASLGDYTYRLDPNGLPQIVLRRGKMVDYRSGPWDGVRFGGGPPLGQNPVFKPIFIFDSNNVYYSFENTDNTISRFVLNQSGLIEHLTWNQRRQEWVDIATLQSDICDEYSHCGPNGICNINELPVCRCPDGFRPRLAQDWVRLDWAGGCVPKTKLDCGVTEAGFRRFVKMKLPDTSNFWVNSTATSGGECAEACLGNCSCVGYAKTEASGCVVWFGNLTDLREYNEGGQDLYIKMAVSDLESIADAKRRRQGVMIAAIVTFIILGMLLSGVIGWYIYRIKKKKAKAEQENNMSKTYKEESQEDDFELPIFDMATILAATKNFASENKIGQGGFGPVYKGELPNGQEIAVKRLSQSSGQGLQEFKNEVILIAKLQHRNLVKLLGYCYIQKEERMLIYEYMPNKSLDYFIFDQNKRKVITWKKRFNIILGIARGLLYLHQDSRLRIIHRDLKASNVLLDSEMDPKISDFGIARIFGKEQTDEKTKRIVGTYGYMSPEYAMNGHFSVKSDVFSFGVLVLEIISGKKNWEFSHPDHGLNLIGHAWKLWNEENTQGLIDKFILDESLLSMNEVVRCIQVGLLCVQHRPEERPIMPSVIFMLSNDIAKLPRPKEPGYCLESYSMKIDSVLSGTSYPSTLNEVTHTTLGGR